MDEMRINIGHTKLKPEVDFIETMTTRAKQYERLLQVVKFEEKTTSQRSICDVVLLYENVARSALEFARTL